MVSGKVCSADGSPALSDEWITICETYMHLWYIHMYRRLVLCEAAYLQWLQEKRVQRPGHRRFVDASITSRDIYERCSSKLA